MREVLIQNTQPIVQNSDADSVKDKNLDADSKGDPYYLTLRGRHHTNKAIKKL